MSRQRQYGALDEAPVLDGDRGFIGFEAALRGEELGPGLLAWAENNRCRRGVAESRLGVVKPAWGNKPLMVESELGSAVRPWGRVYGCGVFRDPNGVEWIVVAAEGAVSRCRPNNVRTGVDLPTGVEVWSDVSFVQAFDELYMLRGRWLAPLVMDDWDDGFEDLVEHWTAQAYASGAEVSYGPSVVVSSVTRSGSVATATCATDHGYVTGSDVEVSGADQTEYNGRVNVTVTGERTFTYKVSGTPVTPATGTIACSNNAYYWKANDVTLDTEVPGVSGKWDRCYTILPNCADGVYIQGRLLAPSWWDPTDGTYTANNYRLKRDYVVASKAMDGRHFDVSEFFRINQGGADELECIVKVSDTDVACLKGRSVHLLRGLYGDLSELTRETLQQGYGCVASRAACLAGRDLMFVSSDRGVVSLKQSEEGKVQGVDVPLSASISEVVKRINWGHGDKVRMAYWDNRLWVAVPLDDARIEGNNLMARVQYLTAWTLIEGLVVGLTYEWTPGAKEDHLYSGTTHLTAAGSFVADAEDIYVHATSGTATAELRWVLEGVNNAVLVYDFQTRTWQSIDMGVALGVKEWVVANVNGRERLLYLSADGFVNLVEESDSGDEVQVMQWGRELDWAEIAWEVLTRDYWAGQGVGERSARRATVVLETRAPRYTISALTAGVEEEVELVSERTRSRVCYDFPFDEPPWDNTNADGDFMTPGRQDYTVVLPEEGFQHPDGVLLGLWQEQIEQLRVAGIRGRVCGLRVVNDQGRARLKPVVIEGGGERGSEGTKI